MSDPVEERLREDFRRWAGDIEPGPELLREVRKIRPARRRTSDRVRISGAAVVAAATVAAVVMAVDGRGPGAPEGRGGEAIAPGGGTTVTARAPEHWGAGTELRVTGRVSPPSGGVRLTVGLRAAQGWTTAGTGQARQDGRYSVPVRLPSGGTATLRVCVTGTASCSAPVRVVADPGPGPWPTPLPSATPGPSATAGPSETPVPSATRAP